MKKIKLIQLLKTFSAAELSDFGKFLKSPFHNESPKMTVLFNFLKKFHPEYKSDKLSKQNVFRTVYGNSKFDDKKLRERFSDLLKLAEGFLAHYTFKADTIKFKSRVLEEYGRRDLPVHFEKVNREIRAVLESTGKRNYSYFYETYLHSNIVRNFQKDKKLLGKRTTESDTLNGEIELFLTYFVSQMLYYYTVMYNREMLLNTQFKYTFSGEILKYIKESRLDRLPYIKLYRLIFKMRENEEDESLYYLLKNTFTGNIDSFNKNDRVNTGIILYNYAHDKYLKGNPAFNNERFEIIKLQLEQKLYSPDDGWLSREQYINGAFVSIELGQLEWAEKFIRDYASKVEPLSRNNSFLYVNGLLHYTQGKYDIALKELSRIKGGDYVYYLAVKTLLSKMYFEKGEFEKVLTLLDSFTHYISTNKTLPSATAKRYRNYLKVLKKLTMLYISGDEQKLSKLEKEIMNYTYNDLTTNKKWMLEKISELRNS